MICSKCDGWFEYPKDIKRYGSHALCKECLLTTTRCSICGKKRHNKDTNGVCEDCAGVVLPPPPVQPPREEVCLVCGRQYDYYNMYSTPDDRYMCHNCAMRFKKCRICGEYKEDTEVMNSTGKRTCLDCRHKNSIGNEFNWRHKPRKFFEHGDDSGILLGVEDELQLRTGVNKQEFIDLVAKTFHPSVAYTMYDGTIGFGTEVVFHPHSLSKLKKLDIQGLLVRSKRSDTTGMHVHINRSAFVGKVHLYKFMRFFSENPDFITAIAKRGPTHRGWAYTDKRVLVRKAMGERVDYDKYVDINLCHEKTVEVRIFRSATTVKDFYSNIEFCHALLLYSKSHNGKDMTDVYKFCKFIEGKTEYINIFNTTSGAGY